MRISPRQKKIIAILFLLFFSSFIFAQEVKEKPAAAPAGNTPKNKKSRNALRKEPGPVSAQYGQDKDLSEFQKQARFYREQGLQLQRLGQIDEASTFYQKAVELDPSYAAAYNDLGVIYEIQGSSEQAEAAYLKAVKIDSYLLSAYANLALFYESKRDLKKALFYWHKRAALGLPDDPWTQKARKRADDIGMVSADASLQFREQEVVDLVKDVLLEKASLMKGDGQTLAAAHFQRAKALYKKGKALAALREAVNAQQLDPANTEFEEFIDKIRTNYLSR